ncbi:unnamed protein product [Caenorhabditis nigoni]
MTKLISTAVLAILAFVTLSEIQSAVLPVSSTGVAVLSSESTSIDTLGSSRVKRNGGCGCCGCGYQSVAVVVVVVVPVVERVAVLDVVRVADHAVVDVVSFWQHLNLRRFSGLRCGCGCCGCGGGGRKRRSLQKLRIDEANRVLGINRKPSKAQC